MATIRKTRKLAQTAGEKYREGMAALAILLLDRGSEDRIGIDPVEDEIIARMQRRVGALRVQWEAAERAADERLEREDLR